jgi:HEAT repeat protein
MRLIPVVGCIAAALLLSPPSARTAEKDNPVPALLKNLSGEDVRVAAGAARSLGVIYSPGDKRPADPVGPVVEALLNALESRKGATLRQEAATALGRIGDAKALDPLKKAIDDEDVQAAAAAAVAVAALMPADDARAYLKKRGDEKSENVQAAICEALAPLAKPEDAEFLVARLPVNNWRVQMNAVKGLDRAVRAGARLKPEAYDQIAAVLGSETVSATTAAVEFLAGIHNEEAIRATIAATQVQGDGGAQDTSWRTRSQALRALRHMGWPTNKPALPAIIRQLGDPVANVTREAHAILNGLKKDRYVTAEDLFPMLLKELEQAKALRLRAAIMEEMGTHVDAQYASRVAKVAADALDESLKDKEAWPLRAHSIILLGAAGHTGSVETMARCTADDVPDVRLAAGDALHKLAKLCPAEQRDKVPPLLIEVIAKPVDWRKAAVAARALGDFPAKEAVEPLTRLLGHNVINVQEAAGKSLAAFAQTKDKELRDLVDKQVFAEVGAKETAWEYGAVVLGALQNKDGVPILTKVLKSGNWRAQVNAADAVVSIAGASAINDKALNDALIEAANSEVKQVQAAANKALRVLAAQTK